MGWASGSEVMNGVIETDQKNVSERKVRRSIYRDVIDVLKKQDWDTMDESLGIDPAYDDLYFKMHPNEE